MSSNSSTAAIIEFQTAIISIEVKVNSIIDKIVPFKEMCVQNNTEEWVNEEIF